MRRLFAVALAVGVVAGAASADAKPLPAPGRASGFYTFTADSNLHGTGPVADLADGFDVWIDRSAAHASRIAPGIEHAVGQLRRYGIAVRYRGLAPAGKLPSGRGVVAVDEASTASAPACTRRSDGESDGITEAVTYPAFQDVGIATRIDGAEVTFCPPMWGNGEDYVTAIAMHEMGHAVGLGHFADSYHGTTQLMSPVVPDVQKYQAGDVNGLRYIAAQTVALEKHSAIQGAVENWTVQTGGLSVSGWAVVGRTSQFADIAVTRDGAAVYRITTNTPRPDIVQRHDARWPNPGFSGSQVPMTDGTHKYCVVASALNSTTVTLGCRSLSYPPPTPTTSPPTLPALGRAPIQVWWNSTAAHAGLGVAAGVLVLLVAGIAYWRRRS